MLMPKRVKRRRVHRGTMAGKAQKGNKVTYGEFGLMAMEASWITSNQIEAARIAMTRYIKRGGKVWIKIFPHKPVTRKPAETRMGAGKGSPEYWVAVVKPGRVMFEIAGVSEEVAREAANDYITDLIMNGFMMSESSLTTYEKDYEDMLVEVEATADGADFTIYISVSQKSLTE